MQQVYYFTLARSRVGDGSLADLAVMVVNMLSVMSLVLPPAAVAALMATLYFIYPYPLIQGFTRYSNYAKYRCSGSGR